MNRIINTEMYYFDGDDGFIYVHFPIRGYALKTRQDNKSILDKLKHQIPLTDNEEKIY